LFDCAGHFLVAAKDPGHVVEAEGRVGHENNGGLPLVCNRVLIGCRADGVAPIVQKGFIGFDIEQSLRAEEALQLRASSKNSMTFVVSNDAAAIESSWNEQNSGTEC